MTKYHITGKGVVDECRAQKRCRLGGESGNENHFTNKKVAEKAAQEILEKKYGEIGSVSRSRKTPTGTQKTLDQLKARGITVNTLSSIDSKGISKVSSDPKVSQIDVVDEGSDKELLRQIMSGQRKVSF